MRRGGRDSVAPARRSVGARRGRACPVPCRNIRGASPRDADGRFRGRLRGAAHGHLKVPLVEIVRDRPDGHRARARRRVRRERQRPVAVGELPAALPGTPDHDTICTFRRNNFEAVAEAFLQVLLLAKELKLLRVGTVSVDGTKVDANAHKRNSIRYGRAAPRTLAPWLAMEHARTAARLSPAYRPSTLSAVCRPTVTQAGQVANCSGFVLHACRWAVALVLTVSMPASRARSAPARPPPAADRRGWPAGDSCRARSQPRPGSGGSAAPPGAVSAAAPGRRRVGVPGARPRRVKGAEPLPGPEGGKSRRPSMKRPPTGHGARP